MPTVEREALIVICVFFSKDTNSRCWNWTETVDIECYLSCSHKSEALERDKCERIETSSFFSLKIKFCVMTRGTRCCGKNDCFHNFTACYYLKRCVGEMLCKTTMRLWWSDHVLRRQQFIREVISADHYNVGLKRQGGQLKMCLETVKEDVESVFGSTPVRELLLEP